MISSLEYRENHPIYSVETNLGYAIFCNNAFDEQFDCEIVLEKEKEPKQEKKVISNEMELAEEKLCNMHFNKAVSKQGSGAGISIVGLDIQYIIFLINYILSVQIMQLNMKL